MALFILRNLCPFLCAHDIACFCFLSPLCFFPLAVRLLALQRFLFQLPFFRVLHRMLFWRRIRPRLNDARIHKRHCQLQKIFALVQPLHGFRLHRQKIIEQKLSLLSVVQSVDKVHHRPASADAKLPLEQIEALAQRQLRPKNVQIFLKSMVHMIAVHPSCLSYLLCFPYLRSAMAHRVCKAPAAEDIVCSLYF